MIQNINKKILLIEDDEDIRELLKELLTCAGYLIDCACNGRDALTHLRSNEPLPALILLDMLMPIMSGLEFRTEQLKDNKLKHIPVIVMSANSQLEKIAKEALADDYLEKPLKIDTILNKINRLISKPNPV